MKWKATALMTAWLIAAAGCGGGGSGSSGGGDNAGATYKGQAFDAALSNAVVKVKTLGGQELASARTDNEGLYSVKVDSNSRFLIFEVGEGSYYEQATGQQVHLAGETLSAIVDTESGEKTININVLTHMQAGIFNYRLDNVFNGNAQSAFNETSLAIAAYADFDPKKSAFKDLSSLTNFNSVDGTAKGSLFSAGVSQFVLQLMEDDAWTDPQNGSVYSSIGFAQAMYEDALADGRLDGQGEAGPLQLGALNLDTNVYRDQLALAMIAFIKSGQNQSDLAVADILPYASRLSALQNGQVYSIFGNQSANPISEIAPTISNVSPGDQSAVHDIVQFTFDVTDFAGIQQVAFTFGDGPTETTSNFDNPVFEVETTAVTDGYYDVVIEATNLNGVSTTEEFQVIVSNDGTTISNHDPGEGQTVRGTYMFSVDMHDPVGINYKEFHIDSDLRTGWSQTSTGYAKSIDTTAYPDGSHVFNVWAQNAVNDEAESFVTFNIDNTAPSVHNYPVGEGDYLEGEVPFDLIIEDLSGIALAELLVDGTSVATGLDTDQFTLDSSLYSEGEHSVVFVTEDAVGNSTTIQNSLFVDNQPPVVDLYYPQDGITVTSDFTAFWTIDDEGTTDAPTDYHNENCGRFADFDGTHKPGCTYLYVGGTIYSGSWLAEQDSRSININNRGAGWNEIRIVAVDMNGTEVEDSINVNFQP